jgi:hypothetical protein
VLVTPIEDKRKGLIDQNCPLMSGERQKMRINMAALSEFKEARGSS